MFKYLLLKAIYDVSDVDLVERSKYDMSFKYFLDMAPEDAVIDPSSLTKFRRLRLQDVSLLDMLIGKTVEIALEKKSSTVKRLSWMPHIQKIGDIHEDDMTTLCKVIENYMVVMSNEG